MKMKDTRYKRETLALLRLFKAIKKEESSTNYSDLGIEFGIIIPTEDEYIIKNAIKLYGFNGLKWNRTLCFSSFLDLSVMVDSEFYLKQIMHYIEVYGADMLVENRHLDTADKSRIEEISNVPPIIGSFKFTNIVPLNSEEISSKIKNLLFSGVALSEESVNDLISLSMYYEDVCIDEIANKEVRNALSIRLDVPSFYADNFLRFFITKTTGTNLLIKDKDTLALVAETSPVEKLSIFNQYFGYYSTTDCLKELSRVFLRHKKLFMAIKFSSYRDKEKYPASQELSSIINRIQKLSKKNHKPMKLTTLDKITMLNEPFTNAELTESLKEATVYRKIRLFNALNYMLKNPKYEIYKIRNGKTFTKKINKIYDFQDYHTIMTRINLILVSLRDDLQDKIKGKTFYIPSEVEYAVPTSEKQFFGNIPFGTRITVPRHSDLLYGVHWENIVSEGEEVSIDLDLKQINKTSVFGWNGVRRNADNTIIYSGDVTNASIDNGGASELFFIDKKAHNQDFIVSLNIYNRSIREEEIPFNFVIGSGNILDNEECSIAPENMLLQVQSSISAKLREKVIGLVELQDSQICYSIIDIPSGSTNCVSSWSEILEQQLSVLKTSSRTNLNLRELIQACGGTVITNSDFEKIPADSLIKANIIDLSPAKISKTEIISLLNK